MWAELVEVRDPFDRLRRGASAALVLRVHEAPGAGDHAGPAGDGPLALGRWAIDRPSVPATTRAPPPSTRTAPRPVSRSLTRARSRRDSASLTEVTLQDEPLRKARWSTQSRVTRAAGTTSITTASSHQINTPPRRCRVRVNMVSPPPVMPNGRIEGQIEGSDLMQVEQQVVGRRDIQHGSGRQPAAIEEPARTAPRRPARPRTRRSPGRPPPHSGAPARSPATAPASVRWAARRRR